VTARQNDHQDVAGYRVVNYETSDSPEFVSLAFAPDLGCTLLRSTILIRGRFGIPIEAVSWEVTLVRFGPPDASLRQVDPTATGH